MKEYHKGHETKIEKEKDWDLIVILGITFLVFVGYMVFVLPLQLERFEIMLRFFGAI